MFMAAKLFFSTSLGKSLLLVLAFALTVFAAFELGSSHGYSDGHTKGFNEGRASRDPEVQHLQDNVVALSKLINDERLAQATKIDKLQSDAANQAVETSKKLNQQIRERDKIIQNYKNQVPPEIQQHCALSMETVQAINKLIDNANGVRNEGPVQGDTATDNSSSGPPVDSPHASNGGRTNTDSNNKGQGENK